MSATTTIEQLLRTRRVIVCCGAGGVGKTSVSSALALSAARLGKQALVVTIDPSKRLAEVLGVSRNAAKPVVLSETIMAEAGVLDASGSVSAWMLDPKIIADGVVKKLKGTSTESNPYLKNRVYRYVTEMISGMQEYTAVEALYQFIHEESYDVVILDTPPSRNALQFLDAPSRMGSFLDSRIFNLFVPGPGGPLRKAARKMISRIFVAALGTDAARELEEFLTLFSDVLRHTNKNASAMREFFRSEDVEFMLVTSARKESLREALYFERRVEKNFGLRLAGYVLNRSFAVQTEKTVAPEQLVQSELSSAEKSALKKFGRFYQQELEEHLSHKKLFQQLSERIGPERISIALPYLTQGVSDIESLSIIADALVDTRFSHNG